MRFNMHEQLSVAEPYRLDLTADALRRLAANLVDVIGEDGAYYRALRDDRGTSLLRVRQTGDGTLDVWGTGRDAERFLPTVERMLGTAVRLDGWQRRAASIPWLGRLARALRGLKPPRYPRLWEACVNAVVFQQISIHAAVSIMGRLVEGLGEPVSHEGVRCIVFPSAEQLLKAPDELLRGAGLSLNKRVHLRSIAEAIVSGTLQDEEIASLPTEQAAARLTKIRGIGPWSAAVVLLRGFGRLDTFPMGDSGVARSVKLLSGDTTVDVGAVLKALGPLRGMLYYHLLLGRTRNLVPVPQD